MANEAIVGLFRPPTKETIASYDTFSTNATASNLPGPGRTLGLVYDYLGSRLERFLNKAALTYGSGPDACLMRIESRAPRLFPGHGELRRSAPTKTDDKIHAQLQKDCRRLMDLHKSPKRRGSARATLCIRRLCEMNAHFKKIFYGDSDAVDGPVFSAADAAVMAEAFRKALRRPDFANGLSTVVEEPEGPCSSPDAVSESILETIPEVLFVPDPIGRPCPLEEGIEDTNKSSIGEILDSTWSTSEPSSSAESSLESLAALKSSHHGKRTISLGWGGSFSKLAQRVLQKQLRTAL